MQELNDVSGYLVESIVRSVKARITLPVGGWCLCFITPEDGICKVYRNVGLTLVNPRCVITTKNQDISLTTYSKLIYTGAVYREQIY